MESSITKRPSLTGWFKPSDIPTNPLQVCSKACLVSCLYSLQAAQHLVFRLQPLRQSLCKRGLGGCLCISSCRDWSQRRLVPLMAALKTRVFKRIDATASIHQAGPRI